ncbi:hypothetical protein ABTK14_22975, partial [Acinetobacter baumannii]
VLGVTMAAALLATATSHAAETVYVGGYGGSTEQAFKEKIIPPFEAKTGSKVVYGSGKSTDLLA